MAADNPKISEDLLDAAKATARFRGRTGSENARRKK
jgi:hypothetical protein